MNKTETSPDRYIPTNAIIDNEIDFCEKHIKNGNRMLGEYYTLLLIAQALREKLK